MEPKLTEDVEERSSYSDHASKLETERGGEVSEESKSLLSVR